MFLDFKDLLEKLYKNHSSQSKFMNEFSEKNIYSTLHSISLKEIFNERTFHTNQFFKYEQQLTKKKEKLYKQEIS